MKNIFKSTLMLIFTFVLIQAFFACKSDELPAPIDTLNCDLVPANYNDSVKAILDSKCSINGCHGDIQSPLLNNYSEALNSSQRIIDRALNAQTMPPLGMPQLTEREKNILRCWSDKGFPENSPQVFTFCDSIIANYNGTVKAILDSKCSINGCHGDIQSPLMNNYSEALNSSQRIIDRALNAQTMPPLGMPQLTEREKSILRCWSDKGFPEN